MIRVTKLNGEDLIVNAELIQTVQATPDTVITLTTDKKILVQEDVKMVIARVIDYRKKISSYPELEKG